MPTLKCRVMKPASFAYLQPMSLRDALAAKQQHGEDASFLAGGQSLVPAMNFRMAQPQILIDINGLADCAGVEILPSAVRIGALTRYRDLERHGELLALFPIFADVLPVLAHPQIRSRGTIGGNLAHADPASEMPAVMIALGARIKAASADGERWINAGDFFTGPLSTALLANEMLVQVEIPVCPAGSGMAFSEVSRRRGDFAIAGVAVAMTLASDRVSALRVGLCGVADRAILAPEAASMIGQEPTDAALVDLALRIAEGLDPPGSLQAAPGYQRQLAQVLCERTLKLARDRAFTFAESA